jgi:hypothetical protein
MDEQDCTARERHDLEPIPEPTVQDVLEGIADALVTAVDLAEPQRSTTRALTILARIHAAAHVHMTADELLTSLRRLQSDWRAS